MTTQKQYQANKLAGMCGTCGIRPPITGRVKCETCTIAKLRSDQASRDKVLTELGGICVCCGEDWLPYLEIDHIHSNGSVQLKELNFRAITCIRQLLIVIEAGYELQLLCANCHQAKTSGRGCKHVEL